MTGTTWRAVSVPTRKTSGDLPRGPGHVTASPGRSNEAAAHAQQNAGGPSYRRASTALIVRNDLTVGANTPDAAKFDITGDVDLAWVGARDTYNVAAAGYVSKWDAVFGSLRSYVLETSAARLITIRWSVDGTAELFMSSDTAFPDPGAGMNPFGIRAFLDVDAGGGNRAATFYTSVDQGQSWQQLGGVVTTAGVTSIFNSTATPTVGGHSALVAVPGHHYQAWIWDSAGALVANPRFIDQSPRQTSFRDDQANVWTVQGSSLIGVI
jgi:hypothetical protein